jgi:LAS superfamily LD-carboxypeptidase LdcB
MAYPVATFVPSSVLKGQQNGNLPDSILTTTDGQADGPDVRLVDNAARAWRALCAAALAAGHTLKAVGPFDSYRPYAVQERIFRQRYTTTTLRGRPTKRWNGAVWYQKPNTAVAAVPGTSNHGWASAVDTGEERDSDAQAESLDDPTLSWLLAHAHLYGWSWEVQSEPWHLRYNTGDHIPAAVLDYEDTGDDVTEAQALAIIEALSEIRDHLRRINPDVEEIRKAVVEKPTDG